MALAQRLRCMGLLAPQHVGSSRSHRAHLCPLRRQADSYPCAAREVLLIFSLEQSIFPFFIFCILSYMRYSCTDDCVFEIYLFCSTGLFFWYHSFIYSGQFLILFYT